jgi:PAS domain S-box-containing protein
MQVEMECDRTPCSGVGELSAQRWLTILGILLLFFSGFSAAAEPNPKNILVVFSARDREYEFDLIKSGVRAHFPAPVNFSVAYLDYQRLEEESYRESLAATLRLGYKEAKPDVLIVSSIEALQFMTQYRDKIFPSVPIIFTAVSTSELEQLKMLPGMTGMTGTVGLRDTIDLALRLHPDANAVALIEAKTGFWWAAAHAELLRHQDKVREIDVIGSPSKQMLATIDALPPHTVALFQLAPQSSTEPAIGAYDILAAVAQRMPTYSAWERLCLNYGCIGGAYRDWRKQTLLIGEIAARVLNGERPEDIPVVDDASFHVEVDWRALRRWHIPESALPPGSVLLYREPTFWERDRKYILAAVVLIVAQALLIIGLLWQRARKRKAEAVLRESEKRFRVMADTAPSLVWMCDAQGKITYLNDRRLAFTGPDPKAGYGDTWTAYIHPDDLRNVSDTVSEALKNHQPFSREYRLRRGDGAYRWILDVASPRVNGDGSFGGFIGSAIDTTDQKLAQQALERVSGQLIEAQEKERSRIARDLHDDICQRLALLSMELAQTNRSSSGSSEALKKSLEDIQKHCSEIAGDVQSLSHQLHSSKLDYLGIVAAIRGFCVEFSKQHRVDIEFSESNVPTDLPKDVSLSLFRVAQEALHNAVKYSGVSQFAIELSGMEDAVRLVVSDAGAGFDVGEAKKNRGLGLVSMQERIHLVHGSFSVESKPWQGTRIMAAVPLIAQKEGPPEDEDVAPEKSGYR